MSKRWGSWLLGLAVVATLAAGCGGDDSGEDAASDTTAAEDTTTTTVADTTTTAPASVAGEVSCGETMPGCTGSITPAEGLADGDEIAIEAAGFTPGTALGITQCADETDPDQGIEITGAGECNLRAIATVEADASGAVATTYIVAAGQTMIDNTESGVTCDATHDCVVSVGELVADADAERATFVLHFA